MLSESFQTYPSEYLLTLSDNSLSDHYRQPKIIIIREHCKS